MEKRDLAAGFWIRSSSQPKWRVCAEAETMKDLRELVRHILRYHVKWRTGK